MYEAAAVRLVDGEELADSPQSFKFATDAMAHVAGTPVSKDGNRPWVHDKVKREGGQFLIIGGKAQTPFFGATPDDLRSTLAPGAKDLTDEQAKFVLDWLIDLGYRCYNIPGPVWQRAIYLAKAQTEVEA